ncbi:MAG: glycogen synthase GlgA [Negativicutes bacterium]|nr:glycogen synthase GlgA [Negativicutes bacterium]
MIKVLIAAAEAAPFFKTGGLGDVVGSLPKALRRLDIDARVMLPLHQTIAAEYRDKMILRHEFDVPVGWRNQYCGLQELDHSGVPFYFLGNDYYFNRPWLYGQYDDAERYAYFCRAVLESLPHLEFVPDIIHCHDWHAGLISVFLTAHYRQRPEYAGIRTLFTIHNLKYQGVFPKEIMGDVLDLGWEHFTADRLEFYDQVSFMKGALTYSDRINTVSRTYADEIQHPFFGEQLDGLLRRRRDALSGIVNGIDYEIYDPANDSRIYCRYGQNWLNKSENKARLQEQLGLPQNRDIPLVAIVSRLVSQKGIDLVARLLEDILALDLQLVILGTGEEHYQNMFWYAAGRYPRKVSANICFDETLARRVYAAADLLLMPSLFEPCGIAQLIAMRYGCLPLVRETGGLKDTVTSYNEQTGAGNGFSFANYNAHDLLHTLRRALEFYQQPAVWEKIVASAMACDYSWDKSAQEYQILYKTLLGEEAVHGSEYHPNYLPEFNTFYGSQHNTVQGRILGPGGKVARQNL